MKEQIIFIYDILAVKFIVVWNEKTPSRLISFHPCGLQALKYHWHSFLKILSIEKRSLTGLEVGGLLS